MNYLLPFIILITIVVFIHEYGHYYFARKFGVGVTDFSRSILIGTLLPFDLFPKIVSSSLLFWSFLIATVVPAIVIMKYDSFKGR